jgi:hypothetical protein
MQDTTDRVGVVVMIITGMIDRVLATAMRVSFQQAQFAQQLRMIRQTDEAAREQRDAFDVDVRLRLWTLLILKTEIAPSTRAPLGLGISDLAPESSRCRLPASNCRRPATDQTSRQQGANFSRVQRQEATRCDSISESEKHWVDARVLSVLVDSIFTRAAS